MKIEDIRGYLDGGSYDFKYDNIEYHIDCGAKSKTKFNVFSGTLRDGGQIINNQIEFLIKLKEELENSNYIIEYKNKEPECELLISLVDEALKYHNNTHNNMIPEKGKTYYYFDDGKILANRRDIVKITKVVPFEDMIDNDVMERWKETTNISNHLLKPMTDYFVYGILELGCEELIFVRTKNNGWFSFNNYMWNGILDIDGSLNHKLENK